MSRLSVITFVLVVFEEPSNVFIGTLAHVYLIMFRISSQQIITSKYKYHTQAKTPDIKLSHPYTIVYRFNS